MEKQRILEAILTMGLPCWTKTYERRPKVTEMVVLPGVLPSWCRCIYLRGQRAEWLLYCLELEWTFNFERMGAQRHAHQRENGDAER